MVYYKFLFIIILRKIHLLLMGTGSLRKSIQILVHGLEHNIIYTSFPLEFLHFIHILDVFFMKMWILVVFCYHIICWVFFFLYNITFVNVIYMIIILAHILFIFNIFFLLLIIIINTENTILLILFLFVVLMTTLIFYYFFLFFSILMILN